MVTRLADRPADPAVRNNPAPDRPIRGHRFAEITELFAWPDDRMPPRCGSVAWQPQELLEEASRGDEPEPPICDPPRFHVPSLTPAPSPAC